MIKNCNFESTHEEKVKFMNERLRHTDLEYLTQRVKEGTPFIQEFVMEFTDKLELYPTYPNYQPGVPGTVDRVFLYHRLQGGPRMG